MKKYLLSLLFVFSASSWVSAQLNLVPNPSFESYTACPNNIGQINFSTGWNSYANTPDYFNVCGDPSFSIPSNAFGYQVPASGSAYSGFLNYVSNAVFPGNFREYIGAILSTSMTVGVKYFVSFKVVLSIEQSVPSNCASSKMGALFSTIPFNSSNPAPTNNLPKIYSNTIVSDTLNWTRIFGSFVADSNYKFIAIGNFFTNDNTDTILMNGVNCSSYYYLDDVCVSQDSSFAAEFTTAMKEYEIKNLVSVYPIPASNYIRINVSDVNSGDHIIISNCLGEEILRKFLVSGDNLIDLPECTSGILILIIIKNDSNKIISKIIKQ